MKVKGIFTFISLVYFCSSCTVVSPGEAGVIFNRWTGSIDAVGQGMVGIVPFVTTVQSYPISLRTYSMVKNSGEGSSKGDDSIDLPTREGQHIKQDISVTYNTSEKKAAEVFKAFKGADIEDIESSFIRRTIMTIAQNAAGQMSLQDIISSQRDLLQKKISEGLIGDFEKMGFELDKVNLGASHLPQSIEAQMQQKMASQQLALQADFELQKQQTLAKARVAEAQGTAEATIINAKAEAEANRMLSTSMTSLIIESKKIDKWDGKLPQVLSGATPIVNIK